MPKYFFNVHDVAPSVDETGHDLPDDEAAWREATKFAGAVCQEIDGRFRPGQHWRLEVADGAKKPLFWIKIEGGRAD